MMDNELDTTLDKLRELFHEQYNRGSRDVLARVVDSLKGRRNGVSPTVQKRGSKQRAARGSAKAFIERVLKEKKAASVPTIMAASRSPAERKVSMAAVRFELYRGKKDRRYRNSKGQWSLAAGTSAAKSTGA